MLKMLYLILLDLVHIAARHHLSLSVVHPVQSEKHSVSLIGNLLQRGNGLFLISNLLIFIIAHCQCHLQPILLIINLLNCLDAVN